MDESLGKKAAQAAGTADHKALINTWDSFGKTAVLIIVGAMSFLILVLFLIFGLPNMAATGMGLSKNVLWFIGAMVLLIAMFTLPKPLHYVAGLSLLVLIAIFFAPFIEWATERADRTINHGEWSESTATQVETPRGPIERPAGRSGTMIAPVNQWSDWYTYPTGHCVYGWGVRDPNGDFFRTRWMDKDGDIWSYDGTQARNLRAFSVRSKSNVPERVQYEVRPRLNGYCPEL